MASEAGHAPTGRSYRSQDGAIHLNGARLFNRNEENSEIYGGVVSPSSAGLGTVVIAGSSGFRSVTANIKSSSVPSTVAGVADLVTVAFASNSSSIDFYFSKPTSSAVAERMAATSTANIASYIALGF